VAKREFRRRKDGRIAVQLDADAVGVLRHVVDDIATIVAEPPDDALRDRLYPRAYLDPTEEAAEADFRSLVHDDLVQSRLAALAAITDGLESAARAGRSTVEVVLGPDDEIAWLTALNDARLVLGTVLGVSEEEPFGFDADDPRRTAATVYEWLGYLQYDLLECLSAELGTAGTEDD
jgi:hypothetical protein